MPDTQHDEEHTVHIWEVEDLKREVVKAAKESKEGVHKVVEFNDKLKETVYADVVAITQLVQSGAKAARQIKLLGIMGRAYVKEHGGKEYIIFKGNQKLRPILKGTRYLKDNAKVSCFVVGRREIIKDAAHGTMIAIVAFIAIDIIAELTSDHPTFTSLGVQIASDALQAVLAGIAAAAAGALLVTVGAPVVLTFVVVTLVGAVAGGALSWLDQEYGLTKAAKARMFAFEALVQKDYALLKTRVDNYAAFAKRRAGESLAVAERRTAEAAHTYYAFAQREAAAELAAAKQRAHEAGQRAAAYGQTLKQQALIEWYKVDRLYESAAQMVSGGGQPHR